MAVRVGMVSLGCAKNQVDGEMLMASLKNAGYELSDDAALADVAIINTCGFIESAKAESIEEILELVTLKKEGRIKKIVVTGCLSQRYQQEIRKEIPEVDAVVGIGANGEIADIIGKVMEGGTQDVFPEKEKMPLCGDRELSTPSYFAYLKIAEGCDNRCTYCAIPLIRGGYRSRTIESVVEEAQKLVDDGAKELIVIAQDTSRYGLDLYGELKLPELLRQLCQIEKLRWVRLLYCYPDTVTDELLDVMASEPKIVKYIDLPLQHASGKVLKAMNRRGDKESLTKLIAHMREKVPGLVLRTTLITGFPGETEEDFTELSEFVQEIRFDRLGCFAYSQEEDTPAALLPDQIDEETKNRRAEIIMEQQMEIMQQKGEEMVGKAVTVLTEGFDRYAECYFGRTAADSPDIDGKVFFTAQGNKPYFGQFVKVRIDDCMDCDLTGERI
ncbi:MAG TPA: 30S ribosomal protein S12 methylthiotransferase RimO [Candidatus Gallacutalibacter pullistercoris]|nr:30S ribosomal protein S12 methylthiotransferase RimO [Candidatus Gallacutalibacter pullistercoris]